ncbi:hypothetical protein B8W99_09385 [Peribacillus simplex]|nr:hypothetical protein B8W99_09385 [Peribacillus simplex]
MDSHNGISRNTKGAGAVAKTGVATTKAAAVKGVTKAKEFSIPNLLPYNPKNQLSLAGGVPNNVVNGAGLKEQLISMAKVESEVNGRGTDNKIDTIKKYIRDIEGRTGRELPKNQIEKLKEALRNKNKKNVTNRNS